VQIATDVLTQSKADLLQFTKPKFEPKLKMLRLKANARLQSKTD